MRRALVLLAIALWLPIGSADADISFPARLDIEETEPGIYAVRFTLPIVGGRKLRAEPLLPPTCRDITPREVRAAATGHTTTWQAVCEPASMAGEAVLIQGLLGTQTDLAFSLSTLDGRLYSEILRPSRPGFLVPPPPLPASLAAEAAAAGMRRVLRELPLWLLVVVAVLAGARGRDLVAGVAAFMIGHVAGQWLGAQGWLTVSVTVRNLLTLTTVAVPAVALAGGGDRWRGWLQPLWPAALLLGALFGGAQPESLSAAGLSTGEQTLALATFTVGVGAGLLLIAIATFELRRVLELVADGRLLGPARRFAGYLVGALATGMLLTRLAAMALLPGGVTRAPLELVLLAAVLGPTLAVAGLGRAWTVPGFVALAAAGTAPGLLGNPPPAGSLLVLGPLLVLGAALAGNRCLPRLWAAGVALVAIPTQSWSLGYELADNVSRSTGATFGAVLVAACILFASLSVSRGLRPGELGLVVRLLGAVVAVAAIVWQLAEYRGLFETRVATDAALGLIRLPVLFLLLVVAAALLWPRRRRVLRELGVESPTRSLHWLLLGAAFLLLPVGTVAVRNPFFEPHAPRGEDARRVVSRVLSDTYHAFNLSDEDELYDRLAASVTDELVDDLYLDSRRRLKAGTREGAEVKVREVRVLDIGDPIESATGGPGFAYDCRWVVTARVRHLQHVHHRQNIYNGLVTLAIDGDRWKIGGVELRSEDRVVLPWKPA